MIRRIIVFLGLVAICGCTNGASHTPTELPGIYRLEIRQVGTETGEPPLILSCVEATSCRGQTKVFLDKLQTVTIVVFATRGAAYLKFLTEEEPLFSGTQPYVYVGSGHSEIGLHYKLLQSYIDDRQGLFQRPVQRTPPAFATIAVDINQDPPAIMEIAPK
jgi:hypothetical protein